MKRWLVFACVFATPVIHAVAQDLPVDLARKELPKAALCTVCEARGLEYGLEKPVAGVRYKGKQYYFCNLKEVADFKKNPESFMPPVLPRPAPKFTVKNLDESAFNADAFKGKVVLVDFWATWCAPCVASMPDMQRLQDRYQEKGFTIVGVSVDEEGAKKVKPFLARKRFTYPILLDTDREAPTWKAFGVHAIPAVFLVNRDGRIVRQWTGKLDKKQIEKTVSALLEEKNAGAK